MWRFQRWQGQGCALQFCLCTPADGARTRTGEPRKGQSMQCGRLKVTLCPKAAVKQVHSRSRAAAPKRQGGFLVNSTELRLDTPASISSHKLDSIIWCNARVDGEKSHRTRRGSCSSLLRGCIGQFRAASALAKARLASNRVTMVALIHSLCPVRHACERIEDRRLQDMCSNWERSK